MSQMSINELGKTEQALEAMLLAVRCAKVGAPWELGRLEPYLYSLTDDHCYLRIKITPQFVRAILSAMNTVPSAPGSYPDQEKPNG